MKLNAAQKSASVWIGLGVLVLGVAYGVYKAFTDFNKGTPYEGTGAVGTLGNVADQLSGGTLSAAGSAIGISLFDLTHADYTPGVFYTVTFPDGVRHAVNADDVNESSGRFLRENVQYILKKDAAGKRVAVRA